MGDPVRFEDLPPAYQKQLIDSGQVPAPEPGPEPAAKGKPVPATLHVHHSRWFGFWLCVTVAITLGFFWTVLNDPVHDAPFVPGYPVASTTTTFPLPTTTTIGKSHK